MKSESNSSLFKKIAYFETGYFTLLVYPFVHLFSHTAQTHRFREVKTYLFLSSCISMSCPPTVIAYVRVSGLWYCGQKTRKFCFESFIFVFSFIIIRRKTTADLIDVTGFKIEKKRNLCVSFSDCVKSDRSNHLIVLSLLKFRTMASCGSESHMSN